MAIFPHFGEMHVIRQEPLIMHYFNNKRESRAPLLDIGFLPLWRMNLSILEIAYSESETDFVQRQSRGTLQIVNTTLLSAPLILLDKVLDQCLR
jgi:hypothetical protein